MAPVLTYKNLQDRVLAWLDEAGDTTTTLTLVKYALTKAHSKRVAQERWPFMLYPPQTFTTVANQQLYPLHSEYVRPLYFRNLTVLDYMTQFDEATLVDSGADWNNDSADALKFVLHGRSEVANQPSSASVVTVSSTVPGDNGSASVTIIGDTATGVRSETITSGSVGSVAFTTIIKVTKGTTPWTGTMTLTTNAATVTLLMLLSTEFGRSYQQIKLLALPPAGQLVEYQFYRQPSTLSADNDRPDIPTPFEELLVYDALLSFAAYNQYDQGVVAIWRNEQAELLLALQQAYSDARALAAATDYTTFIPR